MLLADIYEKLELLSAMSVLVPILGALVKLRALNVTLRVLFIYVVICAITEVLNFAFSDASIVNYSILQNTFTVIECLLISGIYYNELRSRRSRSLIFLFISVYLVISFFALFIFQSFTELNNIITISEGCFLTGLAVSYFYKLNTELNITRLKDHYFFWLNTAVLLYFCTTSVIFLFNTYLENCSVESFQKLYALHLLMNITYNSLLAIAIWKAKKI